MIAARQRTTYGDLLLRGDLSGWQRGYPSMPCPACGKEMYPEPMHQEHGGIFGRSLRAKLVMRCMDRYCDEAVDLH